MMFFEGVATDNREQQLSANASCDSEVFSFSFHFVRRVPDVTKSVGVERGKKKIPREIDWLKR